MSYVTVEKLLNAMKDVFLTAEVVQRGSVGTAKKHEASEQFNNIDKRFDEVDKRFDRIENLILIDHKKRIEHLERELREPKNALAI